MRICIFAMLTPTHITGGMEIHSLELAKGMKELDHEVLMITSRHPDGKKTETIDGVVIHYADCYPTSKKPLGKDSLRILKKLHKEKPIDIIHSQSFSAYHYVKDGLKKKLGIPLVTTMHGTSFSEIKSNLNQGLSLMLIPKITFQLYNHYFKTKSFIKASDQVIAISKELRENIPREFDINAEKVKTIYNGIDTEIFQPTKSRIREEYNGKKILLSVSVLHKQKGIQYLIKAFKKIRQEYEDTHLIIVGDGGYRKQLEGLVTELSLDKDVTFTGNIPNTKTSGYYNTADVFTIPTVRVEGLPLIVLEAMACGKPVVASKIGGIKTVIIDGIDGILVEPGNVGDLEKAILKILADEKLSKKLGANARRTIMEKFSKKKMVEETIRVYEQAQRIKK